MEQVIAACQHIGLRDLHIAPSSLFPCHASLIPALRDGTISRITTSYMNGPLADAVMDGLLLHPVTLQTHGGRAYSIETGRLAIDCAFIAAPAVDDTGNLSGADGPNACGPLGYAMVDATHARHVIAMTDHRTRNLSRICIPADQVDEIVDIKSIGSAANIVSGTTGRTPSASGQKIADLTARLIAASGLLQNGFSFQTGAGATSLAVANSLAPIMVDNEITGSFAAGGITKPLVEMARAGLFQQLWDVQAFDLTAVHSYRADSFHAAMSASKYASPGDPQSIARQLDVMILGAAEVDADFNVNVTLSSDNRIIGGSGGHADTAAGAKLPIVTTPLASGGFAKLTKSLNCLTTRGDTIGALVTESGIAIHPNRPDLCQAAQAANLPITTFEALHARSEDLATHSPSKRPEGRIVAICQSPTGAKIDEIRGGV